VFASDTMTPPNTPALGVTNGTEAGSHLRRIDSCITQLKAQGPSRTCNESKEEEEVINGNPTPETRNPIPKTRNPTP